METNKLWPSYLFQGNATKWIQDKALAFCKGDGIDFGAGKWCLPGAIPVDHTTYFTLEDFDPASLDFVYSSHCLEHIWAWKETLRCLISKIKPNGKIFLYLPHEISPWTGWRKHKWIPDALTMIDALEELGVTLLTHSASPDAYQSFFVVGRKQPPSEDESENEPEEEGHFICTTCGWEGQGKFRPCPACKAAGRIV